VIAKAGIGMRSRSFFVFASLAVSGLALIALVLNSAHKPVGSLYRGLATSEWQREIGSWDVGSPSCGVGGYALWVWHRPSTFAKVCDFLGIPYWQNQCTLPLVEGDPEAIPVLMELFDSPDPKARRIAIEGIRRIGDPAKQAVPLLVKALEDNDFDVSCEAAITLMKWDKARVMQWLGAEK
jgi:hypothetical protein